MLPSRGYVAEDLSRDDSLSMQMVMCCIRGEQLQAFVNQALTTPPEAVKAFLDVVGPQ